MKLPDLHGGDDGAKTTKSIIEFRGLNTNPQPGEGEFEDLSNLTSDYYPFLAPREKRRFMWEVPSYRGIIAVDGDIYSWGGDGLYRNGGRVADGLASDATRGLQLVRFQSKILAFPGAAYYDIDSDTSGFLYNHVNDWGVDFTASVTIGGLSYSTIQIYDNSGAGRNFTGFSVGDAVTVSGCAEAYNNRTAIVEKVEPNTLYFAENAFKDKHEGGHVDVQRRMPDMDFVCAHNNRLWGCKGSDIYASKLGDAKNWYYFVGLSTDSWSASVASDGDFTGCISYGNHVAFFKENVIHQVRGTKPTNFQITDLPCTGLGVQDGCAKSLAIAGDALIYKAPSGVVAYVGSSPEIISQALWGLKKPSLAAACSDGKKYYICMLMGYGTSHETLVYDIARNIWHKEEFPSHHGLVALGDSVYYQGSTGVGAGSKFGIVRTCPPGDKTGDAEDGVFWHAITGDIHEFVAEKKGYSKLQLRVDLDEGSTFLVAISVDGAPFTYVYNTHAKKKGTVIIPIIPTRCDYFKIKLTGSGSCRICGLTRIFQFRSDAG